MRPDKVVDLRSDTVTKPSPAMREAMARAEVGDDVYAEDPTVNRLQEMVAAMLGKEAALFVPSGVMSNQIAIKCHTQPGEEIIVEDHSHIFLYETGATPVISSVQLHTLKGVGGVLSAEQVRAAIRSSDYHLPRTALVCLENTHNKAGGTIYPLEVAKEVSGLCHERGVALHLDGARLWNATVASGTSLQELAAPFDTVTVCFSKGLGAPVGSALVGTRVLIERARKYRKLLGGGMRQAGIIAAGAIYALQQNINRLHEDHKNASLFADRIASIPGFNIEPKSVQTNIVVVDVSQTGKSADEIITYLQPRGVLLTDMGSTAIRGVTHLDVSSEQVLEAANIMVKSLSGDWGNG
jgi:threonine aldolase